MPNSMTGFGRGSRPVSGAAAGAITVELRSVNHRFCEVRSSLPASLSWAQPGLERSIRERFHRGRFDASITWTPAAERRRAALLDEERALAYFEAFRSLAARLGIATQVGIDSILAAPGVIRHEAPAPDPVSLEGPLGEALALACAELAAMRAAEGFALAELVKARLRRLRERLALVSERAREALPRRRHQIEQRLSDLVGPGGIDPDRLAQEVVLLADKLDVSEELERWTVHLDRAEAALDGSDPAGRRLEFLLQELARETNTLGAKCADPLIAEHVVEMKVELERVREQIQNLE